MIYKVTGAIFATAFILVAVATFADEPAKQPDTCFHADQMVALKNLLGQFPTNYGLPVIGAMSSFEQQNRLAAMTPAERLKAAQEAAEASNKALEEAKKAALEAKPGEQPKPGVKK